MSSIAKEIEEAAALRQRIEEEYPNAMECTNALKFVADTVVQQIGTPYGKDHPMIAEILYLYYADSVKEIYDEKEEIISETESMKSFISFNNPFGLQKKFWPKEAAFEETKRILNEKATTAKSEEERLKNSEELKNFENALDTLSNGRIQEWLFIISEALDSNMYTSYFGNNSKELATKMFSNKELRMYKEKLEFYDKYINIIKFNKKLESMSDEEIKNLYISALNTNKQIESIDQEIASLENEKEELTKQLEKKKSEEVNQTSTEEIEKQIKADEAQLKKVYDGLVFMGFDPEQNQKYIKMKEELDKGKRIKDNPKEAIEFLPEIIELKNKINEIDEKLQNQNSLKESTIKEIEERKERVNSTQREEIENKLRQMSGLDFRALDLLKNADEIDLSTFNSYLTSNSKERAIAYINEYKLPPIEKNISDEEAKINNYKMNIENINREIEGYNTNIKEVDSQIDKIKEEQKKYEDFLHDGKLCACTNLWWHKINDDLTGANFTQEESETFNKALELGKAIDDVGETLYHDYDGESNFNSKYHHALESKTRYEEKKAKLENEKLSIIEKHEIKQFIKDYEKGESKKEDKYKNETIIQKGKEFEELKQSLSNTISKMCSLVNGYMQEKYPEVYSTDYHCPALYIENGSVSKIPYHRPFLTARETYYTRQRDELGKTLEQKMYYRNRQCEGLKSSNENLKAVQEEIHKSEEKIEKLKSQKDRFNTYMDRAETGELIPTDASKYLYKQLNADELDINNPTYESEFNQQLGIEEETTAKTR